MTGTFKERLEFNGYLWKNISQETKMFYFREFQVNNLFKILTFCMLITIYSKLYSNIGIYILCSSVLFIKILQKSFYWNSSIDHLVYGVWEKRARVCYKDFPNKLHAKGERPRYISEDIWANWMQY